MVCKTVTLPDKEDTAVNWGIDATTALLTGFTNQSESTPAQHEPFRVDNKQTNNINVSDRLRHRTDKRCS